MVTRIEAQRSFDLDDKDLERDELRMLFEKTTEVTAKESLLRHLRRKVIKWTFTKTGLSMIN